MLTYREQNALSISQTRLSEDNIYIGARISVLGVAKRASITVHVTETGTVVLAFVRVRVRVRVRVGIRVRVRASGVPPSPIMTSACSVTAYDEHVEHVGPW